MTSEPKQRAVTDGDTILATVDVAMPPERVFRALITDEVERWWGSADTYRMTEWRADLRVGGRWSVAVRGVDGTRKPASGEFIAIDPPRKIVLTRRYEWEYPQLGRRDTTVTYRFDPIATGTRVTVRHDGFAGLSGPADQHAEGWERVLGWLDAYLRTESASAAAYARGIDMVNVAYHYLDLVPKGRDEGNRGPFWIRRHDEYGR